MTLSAISVATLIITRKGHLTCVTDKEAPPLNAALQTRLQEAFSKNAIAGLLFLGTHEIASSLPPIWAWWRDFAVRYVTALCALPDAENSENSENNDLKIATPEPAILEAYLLDAPPMQGLEYLSVQLLSDFWQTFHDVLRAELTNSKLSLSAYLKSANPAWNTVGRVYFNLAENRQDVEAPFAFMATYTPRLSKHGKAEHMPLAQALSEFSGARKKTELLSLLMPVERAAKECAWLRQMVQEGDIYHPLRWDSSEAWHFLQDLPKLEASGIINRLPVNWQKNRPPRPMVKAKIGEKAPSKVGLAALLDFQMDVSLGGERLNAEEIAALLKGADGLQLIRGQWVEVDRQKISALLERFENLKQLADKNGLSFAEAMRQIAGASLGEKEVDTADWAEISAGNWLEKTLRDLRAPEGLAQVSPGKMLHANLRPYQEVGVRWLYLLTRLGLGACLADDMGLGKTMQILSLLLVLKTQQKSVNLLIAPASLLANWASEAARFAPDLQLLIAHPSFMDNEKLRHMQEVDLSEKDLVLTTYGTLQRLPLLAQTTWNLLILDEAQAIKNPASKQTRFVKTLKAHARIALTGTPVENRLADLWSIFDFTHSGLLGSAKVFAQFSKQLAEKQHFAPLKNLVRPYILRRLKTDKSVIADLPDKTELKTWCALSAKQAALYQSAVKSLEKALEEAQGENAIARKGIVLSYLMRFKQICNHPSQWLSDGAWAEEDSGKLARLRELAEVIAAKQEKMLIFSQFRETSAPLAAFLGSIFGREGLVLHGGTPVAKRRELVNRFQEDEFTPFFVLSLKAGGAGLNLTAASHVVHFDRWWNPAVENQATDRAYRIGQKKNVLVHKFICRGTIEERIDELIAGKQQLTDDLLGADGKSGSELQLTEMSDAELLNLVRLDIHSAQNE